MIRPTVLIVDDDITNIEIMNAALEADYEVCFSTSGKQALETARASEPDLILLDVMMPGMNGFEVCESLKNDPFLTDIPVVFTTGLDETDDEIRGLSLGAIDYVTKPIQPDILRARVANHVELKRLRDQLANLAITDALTGLSNRRYLEQSLEIECRNLGVSQDWLSVIMIDIDFFKQFNDTYGHPAGDKCISKVAAALTRSVRRGSDLSARYGGEEFACILPKATPQEALLIANEIRNQVEALNIPHAESTISDFITVSIGVASAQCKVGAEPCQWIATADQQLYISKQSGRNRITPMRFFICDNTIEQIAHS